MAESSTVPGDLPVPVAPAAVRLTRRRVYILPTRHGLAFGMTLLVMLLGSVNYDNSLGYMLTFLLGSLALVSILHTYRNLAGLEVRSGRVQPVFAGTDARFPMCLDNRGHEARHTVFLRHPVGLPAGNGRPSEALAATTVAAGKVRCVDLPVRMSRRGRVPLGRIVISTRYPFGLFRAWSKLDLAADCVVYPAPGGRFELPASGAAATRDAGRAGRGRDDFSGFREYFPGDSPRRIYWKAVARDLGMPVKVFSGASAADVALRWEDAGGGDAEARLSQLCRWVLEAERLDHRYALEVPGASVPPGAGADHRRRCLETLALFGATEAERGRGDV